MKILVASDSFKGTLSSYEVGQIIKDVLINDEVDVISISDGGEGIMEALENKLECQRVSLTIEDSLRRSTLGYYLLTDDGEAVIESAVGCGLYQLTEEEKNPLITSTYGVGMMIDDAIKKGAKHIVVGIGGTSTNDGGLGMLEALGVKFYDIDNKRLEKLSGKDLIRIESFDSGNLAKRLEGVHFEIACDVDNPLLGEHGATYTFSPQKGATPEMCSVLEEGMVHFESVVRKTYGNKSSVPGTGAAGGLGYCFVTFFSGVLKSGIDLVLDALHFDKMIKNYDLIITGEGKIDGQTSRGKVPQGILSRSGNIRTIAVCGISESSVMNFEKVFAVVPTVADTKKSLEEPKVCLTELIREHVKPWLLE